MTWNNEKKHNMCCIIQIVINTLKKKIKIVLYCRLVVNLLHWWKYVTKYKYKQMHFSWNENFKNIYIVKNKYYVK